LVGESETSEETYRDDNDPNIVMNAATVVKLIQKLNCPLLGNQVLSIEAIGVHGKIGQWDDADIDPWSGYPPSEMSLTGCGRLKTKRPQRGNRFENSIVDPEAHFVDKRFGGLSGFGPEDFRTDT
jgi:hypothetical protein